MPKPLLPTGPWRHSKPMSMTAAWTLCCWNWSRCVPRRSMAVPTVSIGTSLDARAMGESQQRLYELNAWRETLFSTERERAALRLPRGTHADQPGARARCGLRRGASALKLGGAGESDTDDCGDQWLERP